MFEILCLIVYSDMRQSGHVFTLIHYGHRVDLSDIDVLCDCVQQERTKALLSVPWHLLEVRGCICFLVLFSFIPPWMGT